MFNVSYYIQDSIPTTIDQCNIVSYEEYLISDEDKTQLQPLLSVSVNYSLRRDIAC